MFSPVRSSTVEEEMRFLSSLTVHLLGPCSWTAGWWRPWPARLCCGDKPRSGPKHSADLKETGVPPPAPPLGPRCTGWLHLNEKQGTKSSHSGSTRRINQFLDQRTTSSLSPMGSIQMPSSEGLRGTVRPSVLASMVAGSWWIAPASRDAAVLSPSSTDASSAAVSSSVLHTVTVTLSPGDTEPMRRHLITLVQMTSNIDRGNVQHY